MDQYHLKNQIGKFYSQGSTTYHPNQLSFYTPVFNKILHFDLDQNKNNLMNFTTKSNIEFLNFNHSGNLLLISDSLNNVYLLNYEKEFLIGQKQFSHKISHLFFSQNDQLIFIVSGKFVYIYKCPEKINLKLLEPFQLVRKYNSSAHQQIKNIILGPNDTTFIYTGDDNIIRIVPVFPNQSFKQIYELKGHKNFILGLKQNLSLQGKLISLDYEGSIYQWNLVPKENQQIIQEKDQTITEFEQKLKNSKFILQSKEKIFLENCQLKTAVFHYDLLLVSFSNRSFILFEVQNNQEKLLNQLISFKISDSLVNQVSFHKKQSIISFVTEDGMVSIWNWRSKQYLLQQQSLNQEVSQFSFNKNFQYLAIGDNKGDVKVFDTTSFLNIVTFKEFNRKITVVSSLDGVVRVYDLIKRKMFREMIPETENQITCLDVEEDGEVIFAGGFDPYSIYLWSFMTGKLLDILEGHQGPISHLIYTDYSQNLISASWDKQIQITKAFSKNTNTETININQRIMDIKLSHDKKQIAIATYNNELQLFEIEQGQMICLIDLNQCFLKGNVKSIVFSMDDSKILTVGSNNYIFYFDIAHRMLYQKKEICYNSDFINTKEYLNSKNIVSGVDIQDLKLRINNKNGNSILNKYQVQDYEQDYNLMDFSQNGKFLMINSKQGLLLFSKNDLTNRKISKMNYTKEELMQLLIDKNYGLYSIICLEMKKSELFIPIFYQLQQQDIMQIVNSLNQDSLCQLLLFMIEQNPIKKHSTYLIWTRFIFYFQKERINDSKLGYLLLQLKEKIKQDLDEFRVMTYKTEQQLEFIKNQYE